MRKNMKAIPPLILALTLSLGSQGAIAQADLIDGQVIKIDQSSGKITIKHGPAKRLGMETGMTMVYKAQDPAMLKAVKAGHKNQVRCRASERPIHCDEDQKIPVTQPQEALMSTLRSAAVLTGSSVLLLLAGA
jgi:Cu(I)/Ag(I) efflux system periplasmic protein CusF